MRLPTAPPNYSVPDQSRLRDALESADAQNLKRGYDVEMNAGRVILTSPNGTRYALAVSNAGVLSTTPV
jgi:hypothetical protein